jgi:hypothetical protein
VNILDLQDKLKNFSEEQLVQEMQMPTGQLPQFLLLSEITRRKKMRDAFAQEQMKEGTTTVAQDMVAAAGMPTEFAGQMAGTMAPQTDMAMNNGAMPQQSAMPAPVQGMAGGGIVALQEGGRVSNAPRLVVRGGRQFAEMPDGSLVPLSELGFDAAELAGAGGADLAAPGSGVRQGPTPSQSDLDRRFRDEAVGISGVPARLPAYGADSFMDADLPSVQSPVLVGGGDAVAATQLMRPFGLAEPDYAAARSYPPSVQGEARLPRAPLAPDTFQENFDYGAALPRETADAPSAYIAPSMGATELNLPAVREALGQAGGGAGLVTGLRDAARAGGERPALLDRILGDVRTTGSAITGGLSGLFGSAEDTAVADQDPAAVADAEALAAVTAPPDPRGPLGGPSGGGIAAVAQGAGAPSDFEQELMTMLAAREKRAEQDKWLALAQAGMQLMSSSQPTFGGALGEAGASGLGALRESQAGSEADRLGLLSAIEQSRMGREKMDLERQALAARSAAGGGRALPVAAINALGSQISTISDRLSDTMNPVSPDERMRLSEELRALQQQQSVVTNAYLGQYGIAPAQTAPAAGRVPLN